MRFDIRWPDGNVERCYSPSLIIQELLPSERDYTVFEFLERARAALNIASERVRLKYGFECSAAIDQLKALETRARSYRTSDEMRVLACYSGGYLPPLSSEANPVESGTSTKEKGAV